MGMMCWPPVMGDANPSDATVNNTENVFKLQNSMGRSLHYGTQIKASSSSPALPAIRCFAKHFVSYF